MMRFAAAAGTVRRVVVIHPLNLTPYTPTPHPSPLTACRGDTPHTLHHTTYALNSKLQTLNPQPQTLNHNPYTSKPLNHNTCTTYETLNHNTPNPEPQHRRPKP